MDRPSTVQYRFHQQLIVAYIITNSKIYLIFGEECRTFIEGEWEQQQ